MPSKSLEELASFCKRRGFVFQGSDIYGGVKGIYDYGPMGVELIKNIRRHWWNSVVYNRDDVEGLEASLISHRKAWQYSGHEDGFSDPLVVCMKCGLRMRQDKMVDTTKCDSCKASELAPPKDFKLMIGLSVGATEGELNAYLRPETATLTYINFKNILDCTSRKIPFGIAQTGKAFRNEIAPRNFLFRLREFEQAELQFFVNPKTDMEWFEKWKADRMAWWTDIMGIPAERLRFTEHEQLIFYAKAAFDIEYKFPYGFDEVEGVHNRQDYDLGSHTKAQDEFDIKAKVRKNTDSTAKLSYTDPATNETYIPFVIETAMGTNRCFTAVLDNAYTEEDFGDGNTRIVLKLHPRLSPVKAAIIPLAKNVPEIVAMAEEIRKSLKFLGTGRIMLENSGNVGKSYRRHDEIGTPLCITVDHQSLEDKTITIRDRDSMEQIRLPASELRDYFANFYRTL
ncbi:MAG: glycine--tRNA ligase [Alphaproteobacteria bacterium]|nr:glycine--tRNA ligase [Alphaproteobacteria bacterium]